MPTRTVRTSAGQVGLDQARQRPARPRPGGSLLARPANLHRSTRPSVRELAPRARSRRQPRPERRPTTNLRDRAAAPPTITMRSAPAATVTSASVTVLSPSGRPARSSTTIRAVPSTRTVGRFAPVSSSELASVQTCESPCADNQAPSGEPAGRLGRQRACSRVRGAPRRMRCRPVPAVDVWGGPPLATTVLRIDRAATGLVARPAPSPSARPTRTPASVGAGSRRLSCAPRSSSHRRRVERSRCHVGRPHPARTCHAQHTSQARLGRRRKRRFNRLDDRQGLGRDPRPVRVGQQVADGDQPRRRRTLAGQPGHGESLIAEGSERRRAGRTVSNLASVLRVMPDSANTSARSRIGLRPPPAAVASIANGSGWT